MLIVQSVLWGVIEHGENYEAPPVDKALFLVMGPLERPRYIMVKFNGSQWVTQTDERMPLCMGDIWCEIPTIPDKVKFKAMGVTKDTQLKL